MIVKAVQENLSGRGRQRGGPVGSPAGSLEVKSFGFLHSVELQGLEQMLPLSIRRPPGWHRTWDIFIW